MGPPRSYQGHPTIFRPFDFVYDSPYDGIRGKGIKILVVPVLQEGIDTYCTGVEMRGKVHWKPLREGCGEGVYLWTAPQSPQGLAHLNIESPFGVDNLSFPAEGICYSVLRTLYKSGHQSDVPLLCPE